jgi:hypothetical protein
VGLVVDTSALVAWERGVGEMSSGLPLEDILTIPAANRQLAIWSFNRHIRFNQ